MRHLLLPLVIAVAACQPSRADLDQLARMQQAADPRANAAETISCDTRDVVCARLFLLRGAACAQLTEAPDAASRARNRNCALNDARAAVRLLPENAPPEERRRALTGLAEALKISRDNSADAAAAAALNEEISTTAAALRNVAGGAPYAAYFAADANVFRAQRSGMAEPEACRTLAAARGSLPAAGAPADLARRVTLLGTAIDAAMRPPARSCA
jgi:hypothetical protein